MSDFLAAVQFLTIFPWPRRAERKPDEIGRGAAFFPLVGFLLGALLVAVDRLFRPYLPPMLLAVTLVALLAVLTRGLHLDGLADTFDGLGAGGTRERMLAVMDDPRTGAFGVTAIVFVVLCKVHAIASLDASRPAALLLAPSLARWATAALAYGSKPAKEGLGAHMILHMTGARLLFATATAVIVAIALAGLRGVVAMTLVALLALAFKYYFERRLGGVTGDIFGAVAELGEALVLVAFAVER
ncbi:MAG TPA: adenosylcobinamide-GDP ribazoletransferase [Candidatus Binatia bacterium]|jgi:adenosylcobinamide-GDP ribazoletransferase